MDILNTDRLVLRNTKLEDIYTLHEIIFNDKEVVKHTFGHELFTLEESAEFIKTNCNFDQKLGLSTLIEKKTNEIIGLGGVIKCNYLNKEDYEFGFILAKKAWGKGYATEIGQAQIDYVQNIVKADRVIALVHTQNSSSVKCIKKLGLEYLTTVETKDRDKRAVYVKKFNQ